MFLLQDEYRVRIVGQRCGGEGEAVIAHGDTEPLVAHVEGSQSQLSGFENTQHALALLLLGNILLALTRVVVAEQMMRNWSLVLPPNLIYDRPRLLHPPVDDEPPGRLRNNPVQQDQP